MRNSAEERRFLIASLSPQFVGFEHAALVSVLEIGRKSKSDVQNLRRLRKFA